LYSYIHVHLNKINVVLLCAFSHFIIFLILFLILLCCVGSLYFDFSFYLFPVNNFSASTSTSKILPVLMLIFVQMSLIFILYLVQLTEMVLMYL